MLTWLKPAPVRRGGAPDLAQVITTAIEIADEEGLPAVSMRRIAAALRSGTASLYRILESREEILDRMVDVVLGEALPPVATGDWRADLTAVARNRRALMLRHAWLGPELSGRPSLGPNALTHHERTLAAAAGLTDDPTAASSAVETLLAYVLGAVARETAETQTRQRTPDEVYPYLQQVIDGYPHLRRMVHEAEDFGPDDRFERGLACVLDGIGAQSGA